MGRGVDKLQLPAFDYRIRKGKHTRDEIWDDFRKKYVPLTPEEWVRQHILHFLVTAKHYPASLIGVEVAVKVNRMQKRSDIVAFDLNGEPLMIVECKAPQVEITQEVFDQVAMYNLSFSGKYLLVTNGRAHFACEINHALKTWHFLPDIPDFINHEYRTNDQTTTEFS